MTTSQDNSSTNIKSAAFNSVKWATIGEIVSRSIQPIVTLILARLLMPADFGIVGVAMIAIGFAQMFQDFGLGKALIQRETDVGKSANIVFWTNLILSVAFYLVIFLIAPLLSEFFHEPKVVDVLRVLCVQILLVSLITVQQALLQRNFQFKNLFFIRLFSVLVPGIISVPLALHGYGVWALVFGTLVGAGAQVLLFWKFSTWRPALSYDFYLARQLFGFGRWVLAEAFLLWVIGWGDSILIGHFLGIKELGVYRVGITFITFVFGIFFNPLLSIAYSVFSRMQSDLPNLKESFLKTVKIIAFISLPIGIGLFFLAPAISSLIFGQKWQGIEIVIGIIGLMYSIGWLFGLNHELFGGIGRPDINVKLIMLLTFYYIPVFILAAPYGITVFCFARFTLGMSSILFYLHFMKKILNFNYNYLWEPIKRLLAGDLILAIAVYAAVNFTGTFVGLQGWAKALGIITFGGMTYIIAIWLLEKDVIKQFLKLVKEIVK